MKNYKITIQYDGTNFLGWQRQSSGRSVQGALEKALTDLFRLDIQIDGAGRTDRFVHGKGQVATFSCDTKIETEKIRQILNKRLETDIFISKIEEVDEEFHARYNAAGKIYKYKILNSTEDDVFLANYTHLVKEELDIKKMKEAAKVFCGEHDFKSFMSAGSKITNTVRIIHSIKIEKKDNIIEISFDGNGFLYNMIRILVIVLIYVGLGKKTVADAKMILESKDRSSIPKTAPAQGLYLMKVYY